MRVAIFHDYFSFIGGGEKLVLTLARHLKADVITTNVDRALISKLGFDDVNVISLGTLVGMEPLKQIQATWKFATCDFRGKYDFYIFSGNWAHYAARRHHPNLFYCHTPVRVFYDQRDRMIHSQKNPLAKLAMIAWTAAHGRLDRWSMRRVDRIATNSENTAKRIREYLGRDSTVVYPPCDTSKFSYVENGGFWLAVNRLYPEKRIETQLRAFERMPDEHLVIVGNCGTGDHSVAYAKKIRESLPANVKLVSDLAEEELIDHYGRCRGLITTAMDEDFGLTAVEAMASGKPVIAVGEGGYLESIMDGKTGVLISCHENEIVKAVRMIDADPSHYREACLDRSKKFDVNAFFSGIDALVNDR
jgi:glycosyltransferase involved in cell wall biosynthesis